MACDQHVTAAAVTINPAAAQGGTGLCSALPMPDQSGVKDVAQGSASPQQGSEGQPAPGYEHPEALSPAGSRPRVWLMSVLVPVLLGTDRC